MLHNKPIYRIFLVFYAFISFVYSFEPEVNISKLVNNVKYAVIIDAGSTGSRVFLYKISVNLDTDLAKNSNDNMYNYDIKVTPHIPFSSFKINLSILKLLKESNFNPDTADVKLLNYFAIYFHLSQILEVINTHINEKYRKYTPIFFMATAGMRFLHEDESVYQIKKLKLLFKEIFHEYPFHEEINVSVLSGIDEAIYSFLSLQELLYVHNHQFNRAVAVDNILPKFEDYRFNHILQNNTCNSHKYATVIEIGGGSLQYVTPVPVQLLRGNLVNKNFYEKGELNNESLPILQYIFDNDFYKIEYDSKEIYLYSKSFLGLGRHVALEHYLRMIYEDDVKNRQGNISEAACLPIGLKVLVPEPGLKEVKVDLDEILTEKFDINLNIKPYIVGTGDHEKCSKEIDLLLNKLVKTKLPFVVQDQSSIVGLENVFYVLKTLKNDGKLLEYTNSEILQNLGRKFCPRNVDGLKPFFNENVDIEKLQTFCFNVNFIAKIFTNVLFLDENRKVYPMNTIMNNDITWTLSVNMLNVPNFIENKMSNSYSSTTRLIGGASIILTMDHHWRPYSNPYKNSGNLPIGMESVDYSIMYKQNYPLSSSINPNQSSFVPNNLSIRSDTYLSATDLTNINLANYNNVNYRNETYQTVNNSNNNLNNNNYRSETYKTPLFSRVFNDNGWKSDYKNFDSPRDNREQPKDVRPQPQPVESSSDSPTDTLKTWTIPEHHSTAPMQATAIQCPITSASDHKKSVSDLASTSAKEWDVQEPANSRYAPSLPTSDIIYDKHDYMQYHNTISTSLPAFKWDFLMTSSSENEKLESFKQLISVASENEIPSIISYLIQLIAMRSCHRIFAIKALSFTLVFHPELFTQSFQISYVDNLFTHPSTDDLGASFLRLLLSNMTEIRNDNDSSVNYADLARNYTWKVLLICCNRYGCDKVEMLGASRLRDWVCTFWYKIPISMPEIDICQLCMSWINNRNDAMYLKDGPFTLLLRERDLRGANGYPWLLSNFIRFMFKQSSNLSIDFQNVISMCATPDLSKGHNAVSYTESIVSYFAQYRLEIEKNEAKNTQSEPKAEEKIGAQRQLAKFFTYILDVWIALSCVPWPSRHPSAPFLQFLFDLFQYIIKIECIDPVSQSLRLSLVNNILRVTISRIAVPINAEDASLQAIMLLLHGQTPFIHDPIAPNALSGITNLIRRRLFLWQNVDNGISRQTIQTLQTLYDIIQPVVSAPMDDDFLHLGPLFAHRSQNQPIFPRSNAAAKNDVNEDLSNDILEYVASNCESTKDGENKLKLFLNIPIDNHLSNESINSSYAQPAFDHEPELLSPAFHTNTPSIDLSVPAPGLKNIGNTCYYNSALQALYHTDDFISVLLKNNSQKGMNSTLFKGLQKLFKKMIDPDKGYVNPSFAYKQLPQQFRNKCQHDATEVARYILNELGCDKLAMWKGLFAGIIIQRIKCKCGFVSDTQQTILDFSFTLAEINDLKRPTVQDLMDSFMKKERLVGENKYFCNKCNRNRKADKWNIIVSPPIHLMIILNRNLWDIGRDGKGFPEKNIKHVHVNRVLNISSFNYYLYGSIIHQGFSADSGHYYFVGTRSDTHKYPEKWYKMDDTVATRVDARYIDNISSDQSNSHVPYVLFYRCSQAPPNN